MHHNFNKLKYIRNRNINMQKKNWKIKLQKMKKEILDKKYFKFRKQLKTQLVNNVKEWLIVSIDMI